MFKVQGSRFKVYW